MNSTKIDPKYITKSNPRIGLIALASDFMIERDFINVIKDREVDSFVNRIECYNPLTKENLIKMSNKVTEVTKDILPDQDIDCVVYGCTSGTIAMGESLITSKVHKKKPEALITTPITAAIKAFKKLNLKNIAVLTPYPKDVNLTVFNYLKEKNLKIDSFHSFNLDYDSEIAQVSLDCLLDEISKIDLKTVDGLFVSCTALKIVEILEKVEKKFNTTVVSSNQAIIWDCLRLLNMNIEVKGYGKLFQK